MRVLFLSLTTALFCSFLAAAPALYEVANDKANVRIDSTISSESLGSLHKGEIVEVLDEKFDWYKVILPSTFSGYIFKDFVKLIDERRLEVNATNVNLRSQPTPNSSIIGKVNKGEVLNLVEYSGDWFKVKSYPYAVGWVHKVSLREVNFSSEPSSLVEEIWPKLSLPDIQSKLLLHKYLIGRGEQLVPLLEAKIPASDSNSVYSLIEILSQIALNQSKSGDWELARSFWEAAKKSAPRQASIYLDILQNILMPHEKKEAYFYLQQNGKLSAENIKTALEQFSVKLNNI